MVDTQTINQRCREGVVVLLNHQQLLKALANLLVRFQNGNYKACNSVKLSDHLKIREQAEVEPQILTQHRI